jgi:uncharacterized protein (TIGR00251 family)
MGQDRSKRGNSRADSRTAASHGSPPWLRSDGDGVLIAVHLQPGARRTAIVGAHGDRLKIAVRAPPVEGRANEALIEWLADNLRLLRRDLQIVAGHHSRDKTVRAGGIGIGDARRQLLPD